MTGSWVFCHSSDEHYGADRVLLDVLASLTENELASSQVWLPTDLPHGPRPLCTTLAERGVRADHLALPVVRRAHLTPRGLARLGGRTMATAHELRRARPDLVYLATSAAFLLAPLARALGTTRVVGHVQEIWTPADARVLGPLAHSCHLLVCISEAVRRSLPGSLGRRAVVVENATAEPGAPTSVDLRGGELRVLMSGRWNAWKGHRTLFEAWDRLDAPGRLVVLGGPPESGEPVDVRGLAAALRHPGTVSVVGEVSDPGDHVVEADVVVVPSDRPEPFGLVAIEAFARGRPVIGSDGGGLADIVTDGHDGWLFPHSDSAVLAELLAGLTRPEVARAGRNARATYEARFTQERFTRDWRNALGLPRED